MQSADKSLAEGGSFRDRSGVVYTHSGSIYRIIYENYRENYELCINSGLYQSFVNKGFLVAHEEVADYELPKETLFSVYKVIKPRKLDFISYPYEWSFSQLKRAALLTLAIQKESLDFGLSLKDATAYNVQFEGYKPIFIDTLSFEKYNEGNPWKAYKQFCQHFLAPLCLMVYKGNDFYKLSQLYLDGIPLPVASSILPFKTRFLPSIFSHIHLHARFEGKYSASSSGGRTLNLSKGRLLSLIEHLKQTIESLNLPRTKTEWSDYYDEFSYSEEGIKVKQQKVSEWIEKVSPSTVFDFGANTGMFSQLAAERSKKVLAFDSDFGAIEKLYNQLEREKRSSITPLILDLNNPSPAIGWNNKERKNFADRYKCDMLIFLALIHHISISNNVPFGMVASFLSDITQWLIIEFVPKDDIQIKKLLVTREDVYTDYTLELFKAGFDRYFEILESYAVPDSGRMLFLMRKRNEVS